MFVSVRLAVAGSQNSLPVFIERVSRSVSLNAQRMQPRDECLAVRRDFLEPGGGGRRVAVCGEKHESGTGGTL